MPKPEVAARAAVCSVLGQDTADEPVLEYLTSLALAAAVAEGAGQGELVDDLADALAGCMTLSGNGDDAQALARTVLLRLEQGQQQQAAAPPPGRQPDAEGSAAVGAAAAQPPAAGSAPAPAPAPALALRVSAAAFVPSFKPPPSSHKDVSAVTASAVGGVEPAQGHASHAAPDSRGRGGMPGHQDWGHGDHHQDWAHATHGGAGSHTAPSAPGRGHGSLGAWGADDAGSQRPQLSADAASDLLQLWFPDYSGVALQQLFEAHSQDLWVCVEELLLMEGEEPYENRLAGVHHGAVPAGAAAAAMQQQQHSLALTQSEFPTLGGPASKEGRGTAAPGGATRSAKDALLSTQPRSSRAGSGSVGHAESAAPAAFWHPAQGKAQSSAAAASAWLPGGVPVVATGKALTQLYEEAREEAREHALQRQMCFRKATVAYLSGNRDLAGRLSAQARRHGQEMAEADARAAAHIFWARNAGLVNSAKGSAFLDLHGLHVKEACSLLSSIIQQRQQQAGAGKSLGRLTVCAGAGKHSERAGPKGAAGADQGRLQAAVERMLSRSGLTFRLLQAGLLEVTGC